MTKQNQNLKEKLAEKTGKEIATRPRTISDQINEMIPQFARAMPKGMSSDRLARIALTAVRNNAKLGQCTPTSFFGALMQCAALGLEPNLAGHAYLLPFNDRKTGRMECQFIVGYKGELDLVRRSGEVIGTPAARIVYANDIFVLEYGMTEDTFRHVPWYMRSEDGITEPGEKIGAYVRVRYVRGGGDVYFLPKAKILERRERSMAKNSGPWVTDEEAMWLKTAVRAAFPWLPISIEDRERVEMSDERVVNIDPNTFTLTSTPVEDDDHRPAIEVDMETGEVIEETANQEADNG